MRQYFDAGAIVVPCCDNKTVSGITLSDEYALYQKAHGFTVEEIVKLIDNGFSAAFLHATHRKRLRADALQDCLAVLDAANYDMSAITESDSIHWQEIGVDFTDLKPTYVMQMSRALLIIENPSSQETSARILGWS
jgi:adenosine deaminase